MRKFVAIAFAVVLSVGMLTGCSNSKKAAEATTEVKEETVDYGKGFNENGTLEGVKAADYVTDMVDSDGIYKALKHFRILK